MIFFISNIDYLHIAHTQFTYYFSLNLLTGIILPLNELYCVNALVSLEYLILQFLNVLALFGLGFKQKNCLSFWFGFFHLFNGR